MNPTDVATHDIINEHLSRTEPKLRLATSDESGWYTSVMLDDRSLVRGLWVTTLNGDMTKADYYRASLLAERTRRP